MDEAKDMRVFISWSKKRSGQVAKALQAWLPLVLQGIKEPFISKLIPKGSKGTNVVFDQLASTAFGVVCLTPENTNEPWLNYEAGALAKQYDSAVVPRVWTVLLGMGVEDVHGPLSAFQHTVLEDDDDLYELIKALNDQFQHLEEKRLRESFLAFLPKLKEELAQVPARETKPGKDFDAAEKMNMFEVLLVQIAEAQDEVISWMKAGKSDERIGVALEDLDKSDKDLEDVRRALTLAGSEGASKTELQRLSKTTRMAQLHLRQALHTLSPSSATPPPVSPE